MMIRATTFDNQINKTIIDIRVFKATYRSNGDFDSNTKNIFNFIMDDIENGNIVEIEKE